MKKIVTIGFITLFFSCSTSRIKTEGVQENCDNLKINEIQVLGTHNSYALPVDRKVLDFASPIISKLMENYASSMSEEQKEKMAEFHPNGLDFNESLNYDHPDFREQLNANLRSLEIDVHYDPEGGRFLNPAAYQILKEKGITDLAFHNTKDMEKPGFKVFHMTDIDFRSHYPTFKDALTELKSWSDENPDHTPLFIMIEAKDSGFPIFPNSTKVLPFDKKAYDALDKEITDYLGIDKIITPKQIQGKYATLKEAVLNKNWPTLNDSKGKFVFLLLPGSAGTTSTKESPYLINNSLQDRMMFMQGSRDDDFAAFLLLDNAIMRQEDIKKAVKDGYLVRTRADIETYEAKVNDRARADAAFSSGAQVISTDFYKPGNAYNTDYYITLPNGSDFRENPVNTDYQ